MTHIKKSGEMLREGHGVSNQFTRMDHSGVYAFIVDGGSENKFDDGELVPISDFLETMNGEAETCNGWYRIKPEGNLCEYTAVVETYDGEQMTAEKPYPDESTVMLVKFRICIDGLQEEDFDEFMNYNGMK